MGKYIVKRVLQFIPVFLGVTLILFALQNIVPGDPIKLIGGDKALSPEVELQLRVRYHLVQADEDHRYEAGGQHGVCRSHGV